MTYAALAKNSGLHRNKYNLCHWEKYEDTKTVDPMYNYQKSRTIYNTPVADRLFSLQNDVNDLAFNGGFENADNYP